MYNKIASLILNSAKANGLSDVFVAQPDALKESLAGKIFVLAEIGGKKTDGRKIFDFLTMALSDNYYNDEKILFRGKIEGLKIENIFEVAVTRTNKDLAEYLAAQKIKINPAATSLTIGVIYENKLHFANFGRNRALLVYRHGEDYEIINVETAASESPATALSEEGATASAPKLFSSIVSGEVPVGSYFIFTSEALPEYLSGKDLIDIITKLPPMTAAEQIKNLLSKINTYIPFLGIIVKNTVGSAGPESQEEVTEDASAQSSISSLNYTEQKTERMLAPAGLISFSKIGRTIKQWLENLRPLPPAPAKKYLTADDRVAPAAPDLGAVRSLNLARSDSFLIKEKIFFKKKSGRLWDNLKQTGSLLAGLFNIRAWSGLISGFQAWLASLSVRNRLLFWALSAVVLIFVVSLIGTSWNHKRQLALADFNSRVAAIDAQAADIDAHLLYDDEAGASQILQAAQTDLSVLPQQTKDEQAAYQRLTQRLQAGADKIEKVIHVAAAPQTNDLSGLGVNNLVWVGGKIYAAGGSFVYSLTPNATTTAKTAVSGTQSLGHPALDNKGNIDYWDNDRIVSFNAKTKAAAILPINGLAVAMATTTSFKIFNNNLYLLDAGQNQIYRYTNSGNTYANQSAWLAAPADLSRASDLAIDGDIYVLRANGNILKLFKGAQQDYQSANILPAMTSASKLIVGTNNLYIWEAGSKRLAVLAKKDGHILNQYQLDSLNSPQDFAVDEAGKAAYVLDGGKIYKVALNQ